MDLLCVTFTLLRKCRLLLIYRVFTISNKLYLLFEIPLLIVPALNLNLFGENMPEDISGESPQVSPTDPPPSIPLSNPVSLFSPGQIEKIAVDSVLNGKAVSPTSPLKI